MSESSWTYAIITPDGLLSGALAPIANLLTNRGFTIVAARGITLDYSGIDELYTDPRPRPAGHKSGGVPIPIRMFSELYQIFPGCLLLLHRAARSAVETLLECKGYTRPECAAEDTIRHNAENVFLNNSHCPDDEYSVLRELSVILDPRDVKPLRAMAEAGIQDLEDLIGLSSFEESLPVVNSWDAVSFPAVSVRICLRVISLLAALLRADESALKQLRTAKSNLLAARQMLLSSQTSLGRMMAAKDSIPAEIGIILELAAEAGENSIASGLNGLVSLYQLDGPREVDRVLALAERGVLISPLERIVLESHDLTFRPHQDLAGLYSA